MRLEDSLLHETGHQEITPHLHVLADVQPLARGAQAELHRLLRLARQRAAQAPALDDVRAHGRVAVRPDAVVHVLEGGRVREVRLDAGQVADLVPQAPPHALALLLRAVRGRRGERVPLDHQRVQVDHALVVVEEVYHGLPADVRRERRDGGESRAFGHGVRL